MKRLDRLDITTTDLDDAASTYRRSFGFEVRKSSDGNSATIAIGDAEIVLKSVAPGVAEGMAALWLEADDLDQVVAALEQAGITSTPPRREDGRRILTIDPKFASQVPLFIFDRKA
jgi:hypothetical protein